MIIDYDRNPSLNTDQKLQSLIENIRLALYEIQARIDGVSGDVGTIQAEVESVNEQIAELEDIANDAILRD